MRRLTTIEKGTLTLALVFVVIGVCMIVHPTEMFMFHPVGSNARNLLGPAPSLSHVSEQEVQLYGGIAVLMGIGIGWLALYRPRN